MNAEARVYKAIKEVAQKAQNLYAVDLSTVKIILRNCGKAGGKASCRKFPNGQVTDMKIIINTQLVNDENVSVLINEIIPHEIAHLVCFVRPGLGRNHDRGWSRVCIALGGIGTRTGKFGVTKARRTRKAVYQINGESVDIGIRVHNKIQQGASYTMECSQSRRRTKIRCEDFTGKIVLK